jgi:hypothetical protein
VGTDHKDAAQMKDQIETKVAELWPDADSIEVDISDDVINITVSQMYEYVSLSFKHLRALADYFGTDNISDDNWSSNGCETCDYGSKYTVQLVVRDFDHLIQFVNGARHEANMPDVRQK